jgi:pimeloyl-ACP methyl ester carboxylesterase
VLILLHALGLLTTAHDWDQVAAAMQGRYRVLVPDQRGFGLSDWAPAYSFELMAHDLRGLVENLELDAFSIVGLSMGGTVACLDAETAPRKLRRLVLEDTVPPPYSRPVDPPSSVRREFASFDDLLAEARRQGAQGSHDQLRARLAPGVRQTAGGRLTLRIDPAVAPSIHAQLDDPDPRWWMDLPHISVPTLIVRGAASELLSAERARSAASAIPDSRLVEVEGAGHAVHRDRLATFLEAVISFVG